MWGILAASVMLDLGIFKKEDVERNDGGWILPFRHMWKWTFSGGNLSFSWVYPIVH